MIPAASGDHLEPPSALDAVGRALWSEVTRLYAFDDPGSIEVLFQACACRSRAERCRKLIDQQGEMIATRTGLRGHPLLRDEIAKSCSMRPADRQVRDGPGTGPQRAGPAFGQLMHPDTKRRRRPLIRRAPLWIAEFAEQAMPPRGSDPEGRAAFAAWKRGAAVAGLPLAGSAEGQELLRQCRSTNLRG